LGTGAGTVTQAGTEVISQVGPPALDGSLYSNPFTKLFGKKKKEVTEEVPATWIERKESEEEIFIEEVLAEQEAEEMKKAMDTTPNLVEFFEPMEIGFIDNRLNNYGEAFFDVRELEQIAPKIKKELKKGGIKKKDLPVAFREIIQNVVTHPEGFQENQYDSEGGLDDKVFVPQLVLDPIKGYAADFYVEEKTMLPGTYENIGVTEDILYTKPPALKGLENIGVRPVFSTALPLGAVQKRFTDEQKEALKNSPKGPISPTFLTYSPLWLHLQNLPKKKIPAEKMMELLYIKPEGAGGSKQHGLFSSTKSQKGQNRIATEAIEAYLGDFLLDRKNRGEMVTRQELLDRLADHRSNYSAILTSTESRYAEEPLSEISSEIIAAQPTSYGPLETSYTTSEGSILGKIYREKLNKAFKESDVMPEGFTHDSSLRELTRDEQWDEHTEIEDRVKEEMKPELKRAGILNITTPSSLSMLQDRAIEPYGAPGARGMQIYPEIKRGTIEGLTPTGESLENVLIYDARVDKETQKKLDELGGPPVMGTAAEWQTWVQAAEDIKKKSPFYYDRPDPGMHHWAGPGTVVWSRAKVFTFDENYVNPVTGHKGAKAPLTHETQSLLHGSAQDPDSYKPETYRSKATKGQLTPKQRDVLTKGNKIEQAWEAWESGAHGGSPYAAEVILRSVLPKAFGHLASGRYPGKFGQWLSAADDRNDTRPFSPEKAQQYVAGLQEPMLSTKEWTVIRDKAFEFNEKVILPEVYDKAVEDVYKEQPFRSIGIELSKGQTKYLLKDLIDPDKTVRVESLMDKRLNPEEAFGAASPQRLEELGLLDDSAIGDPEVLATFQNGVDRLVRSVVKEVTKQRTPTFFKTVRPNFLKILRNAPELGIIVAADRRGEIPSFTEHREATKAGQQTEVKERDIVPDMPLKGTWPRASLHADIAKFLQHDPDISHILLPTNSYGGAPKSVYKDRLKEAEKLAKHFYGKDWKNHFFKIAEIQDGDESIYTLEIAPMRETVVLNPGEGMIKGGLVKKAVNHTMNYGNYRPRII